MIKNDFKISRPNHTVTYHTDLLVAGGGLSGVCAAIVAARQGRKVVLVQDRPVLGGNASSEVRLWALGATSHMGNNNRWSREGGVINEILLDNLNRNKEGNPLIFDTILLEKVLEEKNITLLLNTAVLEVEKSSDTQIKSVGAFCSQNSTFYNIVATLFCDATGDGIVGFLSGASFRMGAEKADEFDEGFAPDVADYGDLLGHSIYFSTKDVGRPVKYVAPSFAIKNAGELPRIKNYKFNQHGCKLWWVEYGGRLDTIAQSEDIKMELWKVIYGIWDYVKNSGKYPEAENLTLEWVGTVPGKRESRRFNGDYMLSQKDLVEQRDHYDRVLHAGWAMDLHPADGIYSKHSSCSQWHGKGAYSIPYRCMYSKDIDNLFIVGRIISSSHVAFASSRIMLTCALTGQVAGMAAHLCLKNNLSPRQLSEQDNVKELQLELSKTGHSIPRLAIQDDDDLVQKAAITSSSTLNLSGFKPNNEWQTLVFSTAQLLPFKANSRHNYTLLVKAEKETQLQVVIKTSGSDKHFTPFEVLETMNFDLKPGEQEVKISPNCLLNSDAYVYICFMKNEMVSIPLSDERISGIVTVQNQINEAVSNYGRQDPPAELGFDAFEFWTPERRPEGKNIAMKIEPAIEAFDQQQLKTTPVRPLPTGKTNCWVAEIDDQNPHIDLSWDEAVQISKVKMFFDCDYDHSLECNHMEHPEHQMPFTVSKYTITDDADRVVATTDSNHQAVNEIVFSEKLKTKRLRFTFSQKMSHVPVSLFKITAYE